MPDITNNIPIIRKQLVIFYVLDTSGSMSGAPIACLNQAMRDTLAIIKTIEQNNADAELKIAILTFSTGCKWITNKKPISVDDYFFEDLKAEGLTELGSALKGLNKKLSEDFFLQSTAGNYMPVIIFITDGRPTDNYYENLEELRKNMWFKRARKIAFAVGPDADTTIMADIIGGMEGVFKTNDLRVFADTLKVVSSTIIKKASQSHHIASEKPKEPAAPHKTKEEDKVSPAPDEPLENLTQEERERKIHRGTGLFVTPTDNSDPENDFF